MRSPALGVRVRPEEYICKTAASWYNIPRELQANASDLPRLAFACIRGPVPHSPPRCRANAAHIRQSGPESGPGFQVKQLQTFTLFLASSSLTFVRLHWGWCTQRWLAQRIFIHHIHRCMSPSTTHSRQTGSASSRKVIYLWEGCRENRRCSRDTYPELYVTKNASIRRLESGLEGVGCRVQGFGSRVRISGFGVRIVGFRVQGLGCRLQGFRPDSRHWLFGGWF